MSATVAGSAVYAGGWSAIPGDDGQPYCLFLLCVCLRKAGNRKNGYAERKNSKKKCSQNRQIKFYGRTSFGCGRIPIPTSKGGGEGVEEKPTTRAPKHPDGKAGRRRHSTPPFFFFLFHLKANPRTSIDAVRTRERATTGCAAVGLPCGGRPRHGELPPLR